MRALYTLALAGFFFSAGLMAAAVNFTENTQPAQVCLYREACADGFCRAKAILDYTSDTPGAELKPHPEIWRFPVAAVQTFLATAEVLNDQARPTGFPQNRPTVDAGP